jgi:hypothetical protein
LQKPSSCSTQLCPLPHTLQLLSASTNAKIKSPPLNPILVTPRWLRPKAPSRRVLPPRTMNSSTQEPSLAPEWNQIFQEHNQQAPTTIDLIFAQNMSENHPVGPPISDPKPPDTTQLYFVNPNNFALLAQGGDFDAWCQEMKRLQTDIICAAEHNIDTTSPYACPICHEPADRTFCSYKLELSSSAITLDSTYKPGGTMILSQGNVTGHIISSGQDHMGRWAYTKYAGT